MKMLVTATVAAAALALSVSSVIAQDKGDKGAPKATMKVIAENAKVRAYEVTFAPGAVNTAVPTQSMRVVRALTDGTTERTYADGKKEKVNYKAGDVRVNEASPAYTAKNIGKGELKLYVVQVK